MAKLQEIILPVGIVILVEMSFFFFFLHVNVFSMEVCSELY